VFVACGDDDDDAPDVSADVCPENPSPATDQTIVVDAPETGAEVTNPARVEGSINAFQGNFFVSIVDENGDSVVDDYPGHTDEPDTFLPFSMDVPFFVTEVVDACLIVSRQAEDPERDEQKLQRPVRLLPDATPEASQ
jgi:hypothetical protein